MNTFAESTRISRKCFIAAEQVTVGCQHGATATCVCNYWRILRPGKRFNVSAREHARCFQIAGVRVQSPTATLVCWKPHYKTISFENAFGRTVDAREKCFAHAT